MFVVAKSKAKKAQVALFKGGLIFLAACPVITQVVHRLVSPVWLGQYSGKILAIRDVYNDSAGDTLLRWLHSLHSGQAFGLTRRIMVCISGLLPIIVFVTSIVRVATKTTKDNSQISLNDGLF